MGFRPERLSDQPAEDRAVAAYHKFMADNPAALKRHKQEVSLQRQRAKIVANRLVGFNGTGMAAVVITGKAPVNYFLGGLRRNLGDENLKVVNAKGTIQGEDRGFEYGERFMRKVYQSRHELGRKAVFAFTGFDFSDHESRGTPRIHDSFADLLERLNHHIHHDGDINVLLLGSGEDVDMPTHDKNSDKPHHPIAELVFPKYVLLGDGELEAEGMYRQRALLQEPAQSDLRAVVYKPPAPAIQPVESPLDGLPLDWTQRSFPWK